jgi:hypothetical protein
MVHADEYKAWRLACQSLPVDASADQILWLADTYLKEWRRKRKC